MWCGTPSSFPFLQLVFPLPLTFFRKDHDKSCIIYFNGSNAAASAERYLFCLAIPSLPTSASPPSSSPLSSSLAPSSFRSFSFQHAHAFDEDEVSTDTAQIRPIERLKAMGQIFHTECAEHGLIFKRF